jgi:hypothetical protein
MRLDVICSGRLERLSAAQLNLRSKDPWPPSEERRRSAPRRYETIPWSVDLIPRSTWMRDLLSRT